MTIMQGEGSEAHVLLLDLSGIFDVGQFYVALTRARSRDLLYMEGLDDAMGNLDWEDIAAAIRVHPEALEDAVRNGHLPPRCQPEWKVAQDLLAEWRAEAAFVNRPPAEKSSRLLLTYQP